MRSIQHMDRHMIDGYRADLADACERLRHERATVDDVHDHERDRALATDETNREAIIEIARNAIVAIDALTRVMDFADKLHADDSPAAAVAHAMADEIEAALRGHRR